MLSHRSKNWFFLCFLGVPLLHLLYPVFLYGNQNLMSWPLIPATGGVWWLLNIVFSPVVFLVMLPIILQRAISFLVITLYWWTLSGTVAGILALWFHPMTTWCVPLEKHVNLLGIMFYVIAVFRLWYWEVQCLVTLTIVFTALFALFVFRPWPTSLSSVNSQDWFSNTALWLIILVVLLSFPLRPLLE